MRSPCVRSYLNTWKKKHLVLQLADEHFNVSNADCTLDDADVCGAWVEEQVSRSDQNSSAWVVNALEQ